MWPGPPGEAMGAMGELVVSLPVPYQWYRTGHAPSGAHLPLLTPAAHALSLASLSNHAAAAAAADADTHLGYPACVLAPFRRCVCSPSSAATAAGSRRVPPRTPSTPAWFGGWVGGTCVFVCVRVWMDVRMGSCVTAGRRRCLCCGLSCALLCDPGLQSRRGVLVLWDWDKLPPSLLDIWPAGGCGRRANAGIANEAAATGDGRGGGRGGGGAGGGCRGGGGWEWLVVGGDWRQQWRSASPGLVPRPRRGRAGLRGERG